ncbi:MAG: HEPN domain-containing protein [Thermodesulfobacteriota bacterium]
MTPFEDAEYRIRLAQEHMEDGIFEFDHGRWSKAALSAQLSVENSAKAVISLFGPLAKTHDIAGTLLELRSNPITDEQKRLIEKLAELTEKFGIKEHVLTSYGDEVALKTPRELYDQSKAKRALNMAQSALEIARSMFEKIFLTSQSNSEF